MELSERFIQTLEKEGFDSVYEWQDVPDTFYSIHSHPNKVTVYVTDGSLIIDIEGRKKVVAAGQRFDIPPETPHSVTASETGAIYIVGEMAC